MAHDLQGALSRNRVDPLRTVPQFPLFLHVCGSFPECGYDRASGPPCAPQGARRKEALGDCCAAYTGEGVYARLPTRH